VNGEELPVLGDYAVTTQLQFQETGALFNAEGYALGREPVRSVTADDEGLIGHAGAVLLRKLADQCGLTSALSGALARPGSSRRWTGGAPSGCWWSSSAI
jgi:hypothetical protein